MNYKNHLKLRSIILNVTGEFRELLLYLKINLKCVFDGDKGILHVKIVEIMCTIFFHFIYFSILFSW